MIYYDFAKSLCPEKPVFDPELHSLTSVYHIAPLGVSADYFRTCLWMEHLHGLGAHLFWWWGRRAGLIRLPSRSLNWLGRRCMWLAQGLRSWNWLHRSGQIY